jgi:hypothetical protein
MVRGMTVQPVEMAIDRQQFVGIRYRTTSVHGTRRIIGEVLS